MFLTRKNTIAGAPLRRSFCHYCRKRAFCTMHSRCLRPDVPSPAGTRIRRYLLSQHLSAGLINAVAARLGCALATIVVSTAARVGEVAASSPTPCVLQWKAESFLLVGNTFHAIIGGVMKLTPGKLAGLQRVSDKRGVIAAAAMDQRGSLQKSLAKEKGGEVTSAMMEEFKSLVTEVLTPHASAILLDPEWGLPAAKRRAKNAGLLLAYEKTGYDKTGPGRLPDLLGDWSARRIKEAGADCVKILLYYTPYDSKEINNHKHPWVERIGDECRANDIPFFLEFVGYEEGADEKGLEFAKKKPHIVTESMREFSNDRYGVDVLKVEVPVNMKFVEGTKSFGGQKAYSKKEAIDHFHKAASVATKPFIYLSAGVSNAEFSETLELAGESGVKFNGVLCGRATWKDGIPVYAKQGAAAFRKWLETEGVKNISNVNEKLKTATSWFPIYDVEPAMAGA